MSEATMTPSVKSDINESLKSGSQLLYKDISAMNDEMLANCPGGKARCGFDLLFEIATVNRMFAGIMRGDENEAPRPDGWLVAPSGYRSKDVALKDVTDSVNELLAVVDSLSEDQLARPLETPLGTMPVSRLATMMGNHMMYHSGQLNYIQTIHGDDAFHWMEA